MGQKNFHGNLNIIGEIKKNGTPIQEMQCATYAELKALRDAGELIPGKSYRMIDFITTVDDPECRSAGHSFDLILTADTVNQFNENARACIHEGDDYFVVGVKKSNVQILFTLTDDGEVAYTGTAPHPEDEILLGNYKDGTPCLYKNNEKVYPGEMDYADWFLFVDEFELDGVLYDRWEKYENGGESSGYYILTRIIVNNGEFTEDITVSIIKEYDRPSLWKIQYTIDNDKNRFQWADATNGKGVIYHMIDEQSNDLPYDFKNIQFKRYKITQDTSPIGSFNGRYFASYTRIGEVIKPEGYNVDSSDFIWCYTFSSEYDGEVYPSDNSLSLGVYNNKIGIYRGCLNNVVFFGNNFHDNTIGDDFYDNTIDNNFIRNSIDGSFYFNSINYDFRENSIGRVFVNNSIDNGFGYNIIDGQFNYNIIGSIFTKNSIGYYFQNNIIDSSFEQSIIGRYFYSNSIGTEFHDNFIGNNFHNNTTVNNFYSNIIGNDFHHNSINHISFYSNTIGNNAHDNTIDSFFYSNTIGNDFVNNTINNSFYYNTICDYFTTNTIGSGFRSNIIGSHCQHNTFGNDCHYNIFGNYVYDNFINDSLEWNTIGNGFTKNNIASYFNYNTIGNGFSSNTIYEKYVRHCKFGDGVKLINITTTTQPTDSNYLQYVEIKNGVQGTLSDKKTINAVRNLEYTVTYKPTGSTEIEV